MKKRFWLLKRGSVFYVQDSESGTKESLHTTERKYPSGHLLWTDADYRAFLYDDDYFSRRKNNCR